MARQPAALALRPIEVDVALTLAALGRGAQLAYRVRLRRLGEIDVLIDVGGRFDVDWFRENCNISILFIFLITDTMN